MNVIINGESRAISAETLSVLVEHLGMRPDRVAIELNRVIVPRERWAQIPLNDGDRLEIVHFVGGGSALPNTFKVDWRPRAESNCRPTV